MFHALKNESFVSSELIQNTNSIQNFLLFSKCCLSNWNTVLQNWPSHKVKDSPKNSWIDTCCTAAIGKAPQTE